MAIYLPGIDVSEHNGLSNVISQSFAFARATYSTRPDTMYGAHVRRFRAKPGFIVGAYHFGVGAAQATTEKQVVAFLAASRWADLLALDLEGNWLRNASGKLYLGPTMTLAQGKEFIRLVHLAGKKIGLYHSRSGFPFLGQDWNWPAQWGATAPTGMRWAFWQYQGEPMDRNKFNGDLNSLKRLAGIAVPAPIAAPAQPLRARVDAGSWWDYDVTGNRTTGYRVRRDPRQTGGFSALIGTIIPLRWGGKDRRFAKLTSGGYINRWIDLNDTISVRMV